MTVSVGGILGRENAKFSSKFRALKYHVFNIEVGMGNIWLNKRRVFLVVEGKKCLQNCMNSILKGGTSMDQGRLEFHVGELTSGLNHRESQINGRPRG